MGHILARTARQKLHFESLQVFCSWIWFRYQDVSAGLEGNLLGAGHSRPFELMDGESETW